MKSVPAASVGVPHVRTRPLEQSGERRKNPAQVRRKSPAQNKDTIPRPVGLGLGIAARARAVQVLSSLCPGYVQLLSSHRTWFRLAIWSAH